MQVEEGREMMCSGERCCSYIIEMKFSVMPSRALAEQNRRIYSSNNHDGKHNLHNCSEDYHSHPKQFLFVDSSHS